ncbi:hypothetical protein, partial [Pseudomonas gessardii]|uniref:hypothetical protein n=1 Tax=Pseudomonas gessardii TaxID=78544 RepID=UPI001F182586
FLYSYTSRFSLLFLFFFFQAKAVIRVYPDLLLASEICIRDAPYAKIGAHPLTNFIDLQQQFFLLDTLRPKQQRCPPVTLDLPGQ